MLFFILLLLALVLYFSISKKKTRGNRNNAIHKENLNQQMKVSQPVNIKVEITHKDTNIPTSITKSSYVVFLNWVNGKKILNEYEYPVYFFYEYGIQNCREFHQELITKNYLKEASGEIFLKTKKVEELKILLEKNNLKKTGRKEELIKRIIENIDLSEIKEKGIYEVSEKGKEFLEKYDYILKLRKTSISVEEYEKEKATIDSKFSFNDIIWDIYNKKSLQFFFKKDFGLYRNMILEMANFLHKEGKKKKELSFLLKLLYCDLSGNTNNGMIDDKEILFIVGLDRICLLEEYFTEEMLEECWKIKFPFHYCDKDMFAKIVADIFKGKNSDEILKKYRPKMKDSPKVEWDY